MPLTKATIEDIADLQSICRAAYTQVFASHWELDGLELYLELEFGTDRLLKELASDQYEYHFIADHGEHIGFLKLNYQSDPAQSEQDNCELEKIYILPQYGGRGIGQEAMAQVFEMARIRNKQQLFLCVIDTNVAAIAFYQKLGFSFHSRARLEVPHFKEELRGMHRMMLE
ncbi:MAG: GNAT family N-acetyltransferase, partial [Bacteroidota bacterium]